MEQKELFISEEETTEDRVLSFIISIGSSFPSEIERKLMINLDTANAVINKLINKELLMRIQPDENYPQPCIACRINHMRAQGVVGYGMISQRSWVCATEKGFWFVADKFKGQHRRANECYIETYPNIKDELTQQKNLTTSS